MTNLRRFWSSVLGGFVFGAVGGFIVAVFGPLLFPLRIVLSVVTNPEQTSLFSRPSGDQD